MEEQADAESKVNPSSPTTVRMANGDEHLGVGEKR